MRSRWRPRLVALDIDGTVVDLDGRMPDGVRDAVRRVTEAGVPVVMSTGRSWLATRPIEEVGVGYRVSADFPAGELHGLCRVQSLEELMAEPVSRVIVRDPDAPDGEFLSLAERLGLHGVQYWVGWSAWLDIAPRGVHKAAGLDVVCAREGIDRADVLALGDGFNDIEMLAWAGRGVAIGDAADEVKAAADHVTDTFADGGTVAELERWFA